MITIKINHDDAPEWICEKFTDALTKLGLVVEDVSEPDEAGGSYQIQPPITLFVVYDSFTAHNAYFTTKQQATAFIEELTAKDTAASDHNKYRYHLNTFSQNTGDWE